jgi:predicted 3-demethylubiquinone-9 3-methyltransferase (glyoxalase superfamily)
MPKITTFLTFNDQAEEAVSFYTSVFKSSKILTTTRYREGGPGPKGSLMTASFQLDGQEFVALNGGPMFTFAMGVSLLVNCETQEEVDYFWEKLSEGGTKQPCGWLQDRFGLSWQVVPIILPKLLADQDARKAQRVMNAMMGMKKLDIAGIERAAEG